MSFTARSSPDRLVNQAGSTHSSTMFLENDIRMSASYSKSLTNKSLSVAMRGITSRMMRLQQS
eukprot:scaffold20312_cov185-Amphora_coffeaeformis.AAC.7